ncbi:MAG TPA: tetratricopeptide repeat protein [Candidatus Polarisedimenticolaceae bacterium]|nr:tetratricopeptide repeat protein [Candidatus Polarisedimenticolaceae bacterium]
MTAGRRVALIACGLALAVALVFGRAVRYDFVELDDRSYVVENPQVLSGPTPANVAWAFTTFRQANWHPLTWLSLQLDAAIGGPSPAMFHATSIALHALAAILLFLAFRAMTGCAGRSAAAALLFALHPLRAESVVWISERKDVLSQALGFAAILAYASWVRSGKRSRYAWALALFALALLAKPMMITLPVVLLLLDRWPLDRFALVPRLKEKAPFFALSAISAVLTVVAQAREGAVVGLTALPLGTRLANAAVSAVHYLVATVWPVGLGNPYPFDYAALTPGRVVGCTLVLAALTAAAVFCWRSRPHLAVGWLWYLVTLLPVVGIIQVGAQAMADRYTYLPLVGPVVALVWEVGDRLSSRTAAWALLGIVLVPEAVAGTRQVGLWRDTETLVRHTLAVTPPNAAAHLSLGLTLLRHDRYPEAIDELHKALAISDRITEAWVALAEGLVAEKRGAEALDIFRKARTLDPANDVVQKKLVALLNSEAIRLMRDGGDLAGAERLAREAVERAPGDATSHGTLGVLLARSGRAGEAAHEFQEALRLDPSNEGFRRNLERVRGH